MKKFVQSIACFTATQALFLNKPETGGFDEICEYEEIDLWKQIDARKVRLGKRLNRKLNQLYDTILEQQSGSGDQERIDIGNGN